MKGEEIDALTEIVCAFGYGERRLVTNGARHYWEDREEVALKRCGCSEVLYCPDLNKCKTHKGTPGWRSQVWIALDNEHNKV